MSRIHSGPQGQLISAWPSYSMAALLAAAILFGGGGAEGPFNAAIILCVSAFVLAALLTAHWQGTRRLPAGAMLPVGLLLVFLIVGVAQLIPLPPGAWRGLHGRTLAASALALVPGAADAWRPLSLDPEATRRALAALMLPAAAMLATVGARRSEAVLFVRTIVGCAIFSCVVGGLQLALGAPAWISFYEGTNPGSASGIFANPNHQATLVLTAIVLLGVLIRLRQPSADDARQRSRRKFDPAWLLLPFFVAMTFAAGSRAGALLLVVAVPASLVVSLGRKSPRIWAGVILGAVLLIAVIALFTPAGNQLATGQSFLFSSDKRYAILPDVLFTMRTYWPWGSGLGTFVPAFAVNENLDLASREFVNHAHDDVLELLTETGIAGAVLLVLAGLAVVYRMALARSVDGMRGERSPLAWGGLFVLAIIAMHSLVDYPLRIGSIAAVAGVAVGLMFGDYRRRREESRRRRSLRKWPYLAAAAGAAIIGGQVAMIYAAQAAVRHGNGGLSASIRHQNGQGLALAAEEQVKLHRTADARALAQDAIRHAPLSVVALRVLATVDDLDRRAGMAAWRVASATGWRDAPTQFWAMQQALVNKEYGTAAVRADAMLRTSTEGVRDRIGLVRAIAADPRFRRELLGRLLLTPPWQDAFFEIPANASDQQVQGAFWTLRDLVRLHHSIDPVQSRSLIAALIARKQYAQAIQIRRAISGPNSVAIGSADLSFDQSNQYYIGQATQFEWNFNKAGRAIASVEQSGTRRVMVLETDGRDAYQPVRRFVALEPGPYRLGYAMHGAPAAPRTFGITVSCADSAQPLGSSPTTDLPRGDFVERAFDFVVPPSCPLQLLAFRSEATGGVAQAEFTRLWLRRR